MQQHAKKGSIKKRDIMKANMKKQDLEFDRQIVELRRDPEKCKLAVKKWLEERSQVYGWCWPLKKKIKWPVKLIVKERRGQRMPALQRENESMRETLTGLESKELPRK